MGSTIAVNLRLDAFDVYVGRPGRGLTGIFGNPYRRGEADAIERYEVYLRDRVAQEPAFRRAVLDLVGKRLGCFCATKGGWPAALPAQGARCHGQVLAAVAEELAVDAAARARA